MCGFKNIFYKANSFCVQKGKDSLWFETIKKVKLWGDQKAKSIFGKLYLNYNSQYDFIKSIINNNI